MNEMGDAERICCAIPSLLLLLANICSAFRLCSFIHSLNVCANKAFSVCAAADAVVFECRKCRPFHSSRHMQRILNCRRVIDRNMKIVNKSFRSFEFRFIGKRTVRVRFTVLLTIRTKNKQSNEIEFIASSLTNRRNICVFFYVERLVLSFLHSRTKKMLIIKTE